MIKLLILLLFSFGLSAHEVDYETRMRSVFPDCFGEFEQLPKVDQMTLFIACNHKRQLGKTYKSVEIVWHDDEREGFIPGDIEENTTIEIYSYHHAGGGAGDYSIRFTFPASNCERYKLAVDSHDAMTIVLHRHGLSYIVGYGLYDSKNPFVHIDIRGYMARWGRLCTGCKYIKGHEEVLAVLREKRDAYCMEVL